jgi:hypothetical protein
MIKIRTIPQPLKIVDNFFEVPMIWKNYALKQEYSKDLSEYPGLRSKPLDEINLDIFHNLASKIIAHVTRKSSFERLKIQFSTTTHTDRVENGIHQDEHHYNVAGIIYLQDNPPPDTGTVFFGQNKFGEYKQTVSVQNVYNRMILFHPLTWHAPAGYFGNTLEDSRLTITFFGTAR